MYTPLITRTTKAVDWLFEVPMAEDVQDEIRNGVADKLLGYEVFNAIEELSQSEQDAFLTALRGGDTKENNEVLVRVLRAAKERVIDLWIEEHDARIDAETDHFMDEV